MNNAQLAETATALAELARVTDTDIDEIIDNLTGLCFDEEVAGIIKGESE